MGICSSCLGSNRRASREASETEGLLYEDATQPQYGTVTAGATLPEPDPEELRREREILERICAQTSKCASQQLPLKRRANTLSSELIDVLHHESKLTSDYPDLLNKHFPPSSSGASSPTSTVVDEDAWLAATQGSERELWGEVKGLNPGELVLELHPPNAITK
ncbi:hypothetical protein E4T42_02575 [Aureobasidium subglaciale]|uniref:Late endosomal/lysosomal adaptor and MAPK and MTOR activator 1 n=1 Tax=Aureobasidium subglaciale (strain EXF-2481) TaxID=1043005 RepID=A0A074YWB4_AURSE|nr:uncharacterized protein AUEXF2481DRAFT_26844 [Aureobasidium subglaciale EXF-2481]KAI5212001.1 hypothetical protein E4T38_00894 [Aureobasidium subglaciale]KAI5230706.1 hypothetical protein E4T40_00895 [Aureobasidium subglaciale]KAI5233969.1 hypothetical protein E4T41_00893 [Aureobasidium subglaciale]KAI5253976.1 hypothetical protein E4T42_02575 [Aureobasidium subglaciale]KAI5267377.1 hypothetical protein E4T46_00893 [Aureobasidium subglaciale]